MDVLLKRMKVFLILLKHNPRLLKKILIGKIKMSLPLDVNNKIIKISDVIYDLNFPFPVTEMEIKEKKLGYYETAITHLMQKTLRSGDIFIDVGANVGYLTAIGMSCVGKQGETHAFEPISMYANHIERCAQQNKSFHVKVNHFALSNDEGIAKINFSPPPFTGNSGFIKDPGCEHIYQEQLDVPLMRLDTYIEKNQLVKEKIKLIKIDVEGYEIPVLLGLKNYFTATTHRPVIICEIRANLYAALKYQLKDLIAFLSYYGYQAYNIYAPNIKVDLSAVVETNVVLKAN